MKKRGRVKQPTKKGVIKQPTKIETYPTLLSKRNIIFIFVLILLLIMIIYFAIKTWPIMQERLSDNDNDGIKNYKDKCPNTLEGKTVDQFGCELEKSTQEKKSTPVKEPIKINEELTKVEEKVCSDSDGGKDIWNKGICKDPIENRDYCKKKFEPKLFEYECLNNTCTRESIDCNDHNALCYDGRCIEKTKDSDKDGYLDIDEYKEDTDPFDEDDHPTNITNNCNSRCITLGYISGRGPFDSIGRCNYPEIGKYLSGNSGNICCCTPNVQCTDTDNGKDIYTKGTCNDGTTIIDSCATTYYVNEKWCENNRCMTASIECPANYVCSDGKCIYMETGYYNFQQCLSLQSSHNAEASWRIGYDWTSATCEEYAKAHCSSPNDANNIGFDRNCCWWSCNPVQQCTDTDSGADPWNGGIVKDANGDHKDYCNNQFSLYEFRCVNNIAQKCIVSGDITCLTNANGLGYITTPTPQQGTCYTKCIEIGFASGLCGGGHSGEIHDEWNSLCRRSTDTTSRCYCGPCQ